MSTWPSGAIARATVNGEPNVLAMRANDGHWYSQHGLNWRDEQVTDARPLVVLDPAERPNLMFPVAAMLRDQSLARGATLRWIADEWERQTKPPRMAELTASVGVYQREVWMRRAHGLWENSCGSNVTWGRPDRPRARGRCRMNRLLAILARAWRAFTAPVELDDTDRAW